MQELGVVARLFPLIEAGEKISTTRWREISILPGYMRYVCDGDASRIAIVWVTRCTDLRLSEAAAFLGENRNGPKRSRGCESTIRRSDGPTLYRSLNT